jgi:hypothetical protein
MKANIGGYWTRAEAVSWIAYRGESRVSDDDRATHTKLARAKDELLECCCAGRIRTVAHRRIWPDPSLKYSVGSQDQMRWASAVSNKGHPSDIAEEIPPHGWIALEWEPTDDDECSLRSTSSKRRVWSRVRFLRDDLIREWQSKNASRRGRKPKKYEETTRAMKLAIDEKRISREALERMSGKELEYRFKVGRTTATAARKAVLKDIERAGNSISDK